MSTNTKLPNSVKEVLDNRDAVPLVTGALSKSALDSFKPSLSQLMVIEGGRDTNRDMAGMENCDDYQAHTKMRSARVPCLGSCGDSLERTQHNAE